MRTICAYARMNKKNRLLNRYIEIIESRVYVLNKKIVDAVVENLLYKV